MKESLVIPKRERETEVIDSGEDYAPGTSILEMLTPLPNKNISDDVKKLEDFFDRKANACLKPKNNYKNNVSIRAYKRLLFSQEVQIKFQREFIFFLQKDWKVSKGSLIIFKKF